MSNLYLFGVKDETYNCDVPLPISDLLRHAEHLADHTIGECRLFRIHTHTQGGRIEYRVPHHGSCGRGVSEGNSGCRAGDGRHFRHRWGLQKVLSRRDGHTGCIKTDYQQFVNHIECSNRPINILPTTVFHQHWAGFCLV